MQRTPGTRHRPVFDWTINLGHLLTFVGFILAGMAAYQAMDKRLTVLETQAAHQVSRDQQQDAQTLQSRAEVRDSLRDVAAKLDKLDDRIAGQRK